MKSKICWVLFCRYAKVLVQRNFVIVLVIFNIPLLCYIYYKLNLLNYAWYNRSHRFTLHCRTPPEDMDALMDLSRDLHFVLKKLNITHWLAYGSLWGALRYQNPLPWDTDLDVGVLKDEIIHVSDSKLKAELARKEMEIHYSYWGGFYRVTRGRARADLMVFHNFNYNGFMERVGVESYVFFINYKTMHAFPSGLVLPPLPAMDFAGVAMPVPRGGLEMQKYHYPYDWWKETKPVGCK